MLIIVSFALKKINVVAFSMDYKDCQKNRLMSSIFEHKTENIMSGSSNDTIGKFPGYMITSSRIV